MYFNHFELVVQFPARGSTQVLLCLFPGVLWLWHSLYSVSPHPVSGLHILVYTFVVSRAFVAGAAGRAGDADSSRAPGLTSGLQRSVNVNRGALLLVPQWQCISSFVFHIMITFLIIQLENNETDSRCSYLAGYLALSELALFFRHNKWKMETNLKKIYKPEPT